MIEKGFLRTGKKEECYGCETCAQICGQKALIMKEDPDGFRYPVLDSLKCVDCGLCHKVCPAEQYPDKHPISNSTFGGYIKDFSIRKTSTSGGAFSAVVDIYCETDYVIFGAMADGLTVRHTYVSDKAMIGAFRGSKYSQSVIGESYKQVGQFLKTGKSVVFSGTPCQIAGLTKYLETLRIPSEKLLKIEVVCEGVPSPIYIRKLRKEMVSQRKADIVGLDYRFKECKNSSFNSFKIGIKDQGKWDFEVMRLQLDNGKEIKRDRWFNPFWSVWLKHLMSRPSCYFCPATTPERVADITLGDLWGVHLYCPELYGHNGGASIVVANTDKGKKVLQQAKTLMVGHYLDIKDVIRYQGPMRAPIKYNESRDVCMADLRNDSLTYKDFNKKWADRPSLKLLFKKYVWGNRQKVALYNFRKKISAIYRKQ